MALSTGCIERLQTIEQTTSEDEYVFQILSLKPVNQPQGTPRYRIILSDGVHFMQAMLATQLNNLIQDGTIVKHSVIKIERLTCNYLQGKRLIIVLNLAVLQKEAEKIGNPKNLESSITAPPTVESSNAPVTAANITAPQANPQSGASRPPAEARQAQPSRPNVYPIEGLSPYQQNWTIRARITQKSEIKTWSNARGNGRLFNVTLMDETGEIRATGFNEVVDSLYNKLERGKVYYISKARVNLAKKKFSNLSNDYEIGLEQSTEVEECFETSVPEIKYEFVPLDKLKDRPKDSIVDVIAIVKEAKDVDEIVSKASQRKIKKRDIVLVDQSKSAVNMTLWGGTAEEYNAPDTAVIAFKGVKIGDYGGVNLSMFSSSIMEINPEIDECFALRGWYDRIGSGESFQTQSSNAPGTFSGGGFKRDQLRTIAEIKEVEIIDQQKAEYFSTRAFLVHVNDTTFVYPACKDCNKKVSRVGDDQWRCETHTCQKTFPKPDYRYIMTVAVSDHTGQAWFQAFNEMGKQIMGVDANELMRLKEEDEHALAVAFSRASHKTFNFSVRAKLDVYQDKERIRYGIISAEPVDYAAEARHLRDLLQSSWGRA